MRTLLAVCLAAVAAAGSTGSPAGEARTMTPDDLWRLVRPSHLAVSPDGSRIAYDATTWDLETGKGNTDLFWVPAGGGDPVRLTRQPGRDALPRWSPDGRFLYFVSARDGDPPQVYRLPLAGGEAEKVTDLPGGVTSFALSPDGTQLLVAAASYKDCADLECVRRHLKAEKERAAGGRVFEELLYRHWNEWRGDERSHLYLVRTGEGEAKDLTPGNVDCPPVALGSSHDFAFSPDGGSVALVVNRSPLVAASTDNDIEIVELEGARRTLSPGDGNDAAPRFGPDGRRIFWRSQPRPGYESDRAYLVAAPVGGGTPERLFETPDLSVADFWLVPGGSEVLFTAQSRGRVNLYAVPARGGNVRELVRGGRIGSVAVAPTGAFAVFVRESLTEPPEIFRLDLGSGATRRLTSLNTGWFGSLRLGRPDELWFEGAHQDRVHAWVLHPPGEPDPPSGKTPVIWLVHGGPQGAWLDGQHPRWNMQLFAAPGYHVVAVNFHGSTGYGQAFTDAIRRDWGGAPFEDLMAGLEAARRALPGADLDRVCAAGGSYGGYMVDWMLGHTGRRFRCFVSHAGVYDLVSMYGATEELWFPEWDLGGTPWEAPGDYLRWSPSSYADLFESPTLVIHGQLDFRVPVTQGMQLFTALQRRGVPSRFLYFPDEGHWVTHPANARLWWREVHDWLARWLGEP
ncbi:MAG: S9 family peptidase [Acidobacteria bacterium]|nr:MAG: S9 family peptidase [Acidobacteriota bacterium]